MSGPCLLSAQSALSAQLAKFLKVFLNFSMSLLTRSFFYYLSQEMDPTYEMDLMILQDFEFFGVQQQQCRQ